MPNKQQFIFQEVDLISLKGVTFLIKSEYISYKDADLQNILIV